MEFIEWGASPTLPTQRPHSFYGCPSPRKTGTFPRPCGPSLSEGALNPPQIPSGNHSYHSGAFSPPFTPNGNNRNLCYLLVAYQPTNLICSGFEMKHWIFH